MAKQPKNLVDSIEIPSPCGEDWEKMHSDESARFCQSCQHDIYNFSEMTRGEIKKLIAASKKRKICARVAHNPDGTIKTANQKLHRIASKRASQIAAGVVGASLAIAANVGAQDKPKIGKVAVRQTTNDKQNRDSSQISFTILDPINAPIPNVAVTLTNQKTKKHFTVSTDQQGVAQFNLLTRGRYKIEVEAPKGFQAFGEELINLQNVIEPNIKIILQLPIIGQIVSDWHETPLLQAIAQQDFEAAKRLIATGANVKSKETDGTTALHVAVETGSLEIARMLLDAGADVNAKTKAKQTPLLMVDEDAGADLVRLLIARGANVNQQDDEGETLLMKVVADERIEIVNILLEAGANPNLKDDDGENALSRASGDEEIEKLLKSYGAREN